MLGAVTFLARGSSGPADAHALLVRADPPVNSQLREPPTALTLFFSDPLERSFSSVRVTDQDGNRVEEAVEFDGADDALMRVSLAELSPGFITVDRKEAAEVSVVVDRNHLALLATGYREQGPDEPPEA